MFERLGLTPAQILTQFYHTAFYLERAVVLVPNLKIFMHSDGA